MSTGLWIVLAAIAVAAGFGIYRLRTDGTFRGGLEAPDNTADPTWTAVRTAVPAAVLGERATLVQFSSAFCTPCRATRRILSDVASAVPGVVHVEIDAEQHLELVRTLDVSRTPTTLVLDKTGREITRAAGAPRKEQVLQAVSGV